MKKLIYLIRHGESVQNRRDLLSGISDVPLSDRGRQQCLRLRGFFERFPVELVFSSPLSRAMESARIIFPNQDVKVAQGLIEFDYGDYEGVPRTHDDEIMKQWNLAPGEVSFPGGKSVRKHAREVYEELLSIVMAASATRIACVSHRTTIRLIVAQVIGLDLNKFRLLPCSNCSITILEADTTGKLLLRSLNMEIEAIGEALYGRENAA